MDSAAFRILLETSGYEIRFREQEWVECLISGDGEVWVGHGSDRDAAFAAALRLACPTALSARLLCSALRGDEPALDRVALSRWPPWEVGAAPPRLTAKLPSVLIKASAPPPARHIEPPPVVVVAPEQQRTPGQIAVIVSRPPPPRSPSGNFAVSAVTDQRSAQENRTVGDADEALEELDILMDRIRDSREELGLCAPDRQRLAMLAWICLARAHTDSFPDDLRIRDRVSAISRQLTEIGKTFWPGSVTALQLHMQPRDLPRHLLGGVATTWRRAADLAEQALRNREHEDERRGYDHYGWADAKQTQPHSPRAAEMLGELVAAVEALSGLLDLQAAPVDTSVRPDGAIFQRWVRQLRWLRGADVEPDRWARLAGRFRWWAFRREPALHPAARELEPGYVPAYPWAHLLGEDPEKRRHERELRATLAAPPTINSKEDAGTWLTKALVFSDTHHGNIVKLIEASKDIVLQLLPEDLPDSDRRLRRRLSRLQDDLRESGEVSVSPLPAAAPAEGSEEEPAASEGNGKVSLPPQLIDRVRPVTEGKRSVFVSHRRDPDLQAELQEAFGFKSLDCRIAEARRMQQLGEAIAEDKYDLVLGATGFQSHTLDTVLARACRNAGVQYIRVNDGRPLVCLRAVARDFGR